MNGAALFPFAAPTPFSIIVSLVGGLAILLYGLGLSGKALEEAAGWRLHGRMRWVTKSRVLSAAFGALLTVLFQSSSATTVILVGLARAGALSASQAIPILLGADLGTTLTVQLIAFDLYAFSPLIIALGFFIHFNATQKTARLIGGTILGVGFIFFGLYLMVAGLKPVSSYPFVREGLLTTKDWPLLVIGVAALLTALFHSSAAILGIALAMGGEGMITIETAIPIILGANIGTCATAVMASLTGSVEAKRVAMAHVLSKFLGVLLLYPFIHPFAAYLTGTAEALPRQIAHAHTLFNLGLLVLFLPLSAPFARWVTRLVPTRPQEEALSRPKYLDPNLLESPSFALEQAAMESLRMATIVQGMLKDVKQVFTEGDHRGLMEEIKQREEAVDHLNREIKLYLIQLSKNLSEKESAREMALLNFISHLENMGDIIDDNLLELGEKKRVEGVHFSDAGLTEIHLFHQMVCQDFDDVILAFGTDQEERARKVIAEREAFHQRAQEMRAAHIARLHQGLSRAIESSAIHLDLITHFSRIKSHITAIAHTIVERVSFL